jgi:7-keto-8-aminopelargonate synthetase-like enzyme
VEHFGLHGRVDLQLGTFGKALGGFGAFVAGPRRLLELMVNRARPLIFSTSLPPAVLGAAQAAVELTVSAEGAQRRRQLHANARCFTAALRMHGLCPIQPGSHIAPVLTGEPGTTRRAAATLLADGILLQGIRPPTVPAGTCRLRATLMADHPTAELESAAAAIARRVAEAVHG